MGYLVEDLELFIRKVAHAKYDATVLVRWSNICMGVRASRKNQSEMRSYAHRRIFIEKVHIFVFLVSKHNVESVHRNINICL
jgi:hypothetical protein